MGVLGVSVWHGWPVLSHGAYVEYYLEWQFLSNGLLLVLAGVWGLWALGQWPVIWLRRLRWIGLGMLLLNMVFAVAQKHGLVWHLGSWHPADIYPEAIMRYGSNPVKPSGVMGLDRVLGAYAVAWLPILCAWRWWLGAIPLLLVACAMKTSIWLGATVALVGMSRGRWKLVVGGMGVVMALVYSDGEIAKKLLQRWETWGPILSAVKDHPWVGHSFSFLAYSCAQVLYGARLPSLHSDWLALLFHAGGVVTGLVAFAWRQAVRAVPQTRWASALQVSFASIGVMALGQSVVSEPGLTGLLVLLLAWWWSEQRTECDA